MTILADRKSWSTHVHVFDMNSVLSIVHSPSVGLLDRLLNIEKILKHLLVLPAVMPC